VLFETAEEAIKAAEGLNQKEVEGEKHIRVDVCSKEGRTK
jgi:hypothetical protein